MILPEGCTFRSVSLRLSYKQHSIFQKQARSLSKQRPSYKHATGRLQFGDVSIKVALFKKLPDFYDPCIISITAYSFPKYPNTFNFL